MSLKHAQNPVIQALLQRRSTPAKALTAPSPSEEELQLAIECGTTAPDHGALRPWRVRILQDEQRELLADAFGRAFTRLNPDASEQAIETARSKALRAPTIIAVASETRHDVPKVPAFEQVASTAVFIEHIQLALNAMDYGCVWVTGPLSQTKEVKDALGFADSVDVVGLIQVGTPSVMPPPRKAVELASILVNK